MCEGAPQIFVKFFSGISFIWEQINWAENVNDDSYLEVSGICERVNVQIVNFLAKAKIKMRISSRRTIKAIKKDIITVLLILAKLLNLTDSLF